MAILATIEVNDLGSPVIDKFVDALSRIGSEVARTQAQINNANAGGTSSTRQYSDALTDVVGVSRATAAEQINLANAAIKSASGIGALFSGVQDIGAALQAAAQLTSVYAGALSALATAFNESKGATVEQVAAIADLTRAAAAGNGFTAEQAALLGQLNTKLQQGLPLTQAEAQAMQVLADDYAIANREALGLGTAIQILLQREQQAAAAAQEHGRAFEVLASQLQAGQRATLLQKEALSELAGAIQTNKKFTADQKAELQGLADALQKNGSLTREQVVAFNDLNSAYQRSISATKEETNAVQGLSEAAKALLGILSLLLIDGMKSLLDESGRLAARVETLGVVMNVVAKNAQLSTTEMRVQAETIKKLGITTQEAENSVIQFVQANLKLADASKVARVAQDLAVVAGVNSSQAFQTLTAAIQKQEPMLLRQFGIVTGLDKIYTDYAKTLNKTVKELDGVEKKQAFVNAILEQGEKVAGAYEQAMSTTGKQLTSLARYIEEAKLKLGDGLVPVMGIAVRVTTDLLKAWIDLPAPLQNLTTAAAGATVVVVALLTAMAAGRWLGIADAIVRLYGAFSTLFVLLRNGVAGAEALGIAFGTVNLWLTAIVVAIGLATAAWIYYNKETEITVDRYVNLGASVEAGTRSLEKNFAAVGKSADAYTKLRAEHDKLDGVTSRTRDQEDRLAVVTAKMEAEQAKYNRALGALQALAPGAVAAIKSQESAYADMLPVLAKVHEAREKEAKLALGNAQIQLGRAEALHKSSMEENAAALDSLKVVEDQIAAAKSGTVVYETQSKIVAHGAVVTQTAAVSMAELTKRQKELQDKAVETGEAMKKAGGDMTRFTLEVHDLNSSIHPELLASENKAAVALDFSNASDQFKNLAERARLAGMTLKDLKDAPNPEAFKAALQKVQDAWDKHVKEMEAAQKKYDARFKATSERITSLTASEKADFAALNKALGEAGISQEEYNRRVQLGASILQDYAKKPAELTKQFAGLAAGYKSLLSQAWDKEFTDRVTKTTKQFEDLNLASMQSTAKLAEQFAHEDETANLKLIEQKKAQNEEVYRQDRDLYERLIVSKMREVDREIYQERKRLDEILHAAIKEKEARQLEVDAMRRAVEEKAKLLVQEIADKAAKIKTDGQLEDAAAMDAIRRDRTINDALRGVKLLAIQEAAAQREKDLQKYTQDATARVLITTTAERAEVEQRQQAANQMNAITDAQSAKEIAASDHMVAVIKKNYEELTILGRTILGGAVEAFAAGIAKMSVGAENFKDFLKGIWQSILNSVSSVIQQMVTKWILGWSVVQKLMGTGATGPGGGVGQSLANTATNSLFKVAAGKLLAGGAGATTISGGGEITVISTAGGGTLGRGGIAATTGGTLPGAGGQSAALANMSNLQAGLISAGAGYIAAGIADKVFQKWIDGSSIKGTAVGALAGAGGGAAAGATIGAFGGPIGAGAGALIGAGVGAIKGWWDARKMRKEMEADRKDILEQLGGLDEFKKKAEAAGFAYDKFLSTKSPKDFGAEVVKMKAAFDALDLKNAREEMVKAAGGMEALQHQMQLVGFDSTKLFATKDIKEYNSEVERMNKLFEAQQKRLEGLSTAAQGLNTRVKSFADGLEKDFGRTFAKLGKDGEQFFKDFQDAQAKGFGGGISKFIAQAIFDATKAGDLKKALDLTSIADDILVQNQRAQKSFNTLGLVATTTFAAVLRETGDINQAFAAVGDSLDTLIDLQGKWGFEGSAALQKLLELRLVAKANDDLVAGLSATVAILKGLGDAGRLDQDTFNALGDDAANMFQTFIDRGVDANSALLLSQPTLQALWEAQKKYGFETDEATKALLKMAEEQGVVGPQMQTVNDKMLDVLLLIAKALGATIPAALDTMATHAHTSTTNTTQDLDAAARAAGSLDDRIRTATNRFGDMGDAAEEAGRRAEAAATGAAEGHSPTGIKQIVYRLKEAHGLFNDFRDTFVSGAGQMERSSGFGKVLQFAPPSAQRQQNQGAQTIVVHHTSSVNLTVNGTKATAKEQWDELRPVLDRQVDANEGQLAAKIAKAVDRHRKAS